MTLTPHGEPRCPHVAASVWGPARCVLPEGHTGRHAYGPGPAERITSRVALNPETGCWDWLGGKARDGYAKLCSEHAHRVSYAMFVGPIPDGYQVDHLCFRPICVNPAHLEAVTPAENIRRRYARVSHCKHGHEFTEANTYRWRGRRSCRACNRSRVAAYAARKRAAALPHPSTDPDG